MYMIGLHKESRPTNIFLSSRYCRITVLVSNVVLYNKLSDERERGFARKRKIREITHAPKNIYLPKWRLIGSECFSFIAACTW